MLRLFKRKINNQKQHKPAVTCIYYHIHQLADTVQVHVLAIFNALYTVSGEKRPP